MHKNFDDIINEGHEKANVCLLRYNYNAASKNEKQPNMDGKEYGPDCLFRFFADIGSIENPSYPEESNSGLTSPRQAPEGHHRQVLQRQAQQGQAG